MEKQAHRIADKIAQSFGYDEEKTAVVSYGLLAILQMVIIFAMTFIIGWIGGFCLECMIIFLSVGFLRRSIGGGHSNSFTGCLIISIFIISLFAFLSRYLFGPNEPLWFVVAYSVVYLIAFYIIYKRAPMDSSNKPIVREEKIRRLRRTGFITWALYYAITIAFTFLSVKNVRFINLAMSLTLATIWQTFMLTGIGNKFIRTVDRKFQSE